MIFIPLFVKICYVQTDQKSPPNHFIGAAHSRLTTTQNPQLSARFHEFSRTQN
jgi:hypothetical protein